MDALGPAFDNCWPAAAIAGKTRPASRGDSSLKHSAPEEESKETRATTAWSNPVSDEEEEDALAGYDPVQRDNLLEQLREQYQRRLDLHQEMAEITAEQQMQ